ncbi:LamG-like jellyroll fold domain-containing protein [Micromonospora sp. NPDC049679]|uniref:LamG-like jellyroll fold domain-containing protein n=1 Tax=Micromonospora sp. NPDC049679 TaxID=3155920 RepID=UPI0033D6C0AE
MSTAHRSLRRLSASLLATATATAAATFVIGVTAGPSAAALAPDQPLSGTASSMWQTNDTVRALAVSGGVVYVGGDFTSVRPPGNASGAGEVTRTRLAAFNASTGALVTSFNATINGNVFGLSISPDGSRLYAVGSFTTVNGVTRNRMAAFNLPGGSLITGWAPSASATVTAVHAGAGAVYVGGDFNTVNSVAKGRLAALHPTTGALIAGFTASANNRSVAIELAPAAGRLLIGGTFTTVNGVDQNAIAALDPATGATRPWAATGIAPNRPNCVAHVTDIEISGDTAYVSAEDENVGCYDGTYAAKVADGALVWNSYCYGGTQAVKVVNGWLYKGSHQHDCGYNPGGYVGTQDRNTFFFNRLVAQSLADGSQGHWSPNTNATTSTNPVGPRVLASDGTQLFVGGDFTTVNNAAQQGITRFRPGGGTAPDRPVAPTVTATAAGTLTVTFPAVADRDSGTLTYSIYRDGGTTPVATRTAESWPWTRPTLRFDDTGLPAGSSHTYTVAASDGTLSSGRSPNSASATVNGSDPASYPATVLGSGPETYWRLNDSAGTAADSSPANRAGTYVGGVTRGQTGAIGDDTAVTVNGSSGYVTADQPAPAPAAFTQAAWFRTTTLTGGTILGFSNAQTGPGTINDRAVWMDNNGQLEFGLRQTASATSRFTYVRSPNSYNDGAWHQVAATYDGTTMSLYVDGALAASAAATHAGSGTGYLRAGYTDLTRFDTVFGPNQTARTSPNSFYLNGSLDEVGAWSRALPADQVRAQWISSVVGGSTPPPPAASYAGTVLGDAPSMYWRLNETATGAVADSSGNGRGGTYRAGLTFGAAGAIVGDADTAIGSPGSSGVAYSNTSAAGPTTYSLEVWFQTTTTRGGKLLGLENVQTGWGTSYDRQLYLTNAGRLAFGTMSGGAQRVVESGVSYNDGAWHHAVATQGPGGMTLYVDGAAVGTDATTTPDAATGFWRLGGGNLTGWQNAPTSSAVAGTIDEAAVYPTALTAAQVASHFTRAGR